MYVEDSYGSDLGRNFDSISLKLDRMMDTMKNLTCILFGPNRPNENGAVTRGAMSIFKTIGRLDSERDEKHSGKMILSEFKANLRGKFLSDLA